MITVVCFLWSDPARQRSYTFGHEHVRVLKRMVERHLSLPHRFVCLTDDKIEDIECIPLDWRTHVEGTCGLKLQVWRPDIGETLGPRILVLDLDIVVTGDITPIAGRTESVVLFRNPNHIAGGRRAFYQGSVQLITAGARPHVWSNLFKPWAGNVINSRFGGFEQAWLSEMLSWEAEATWSGADGIYGAGRIGDYSNNTIADLPDNARIVVFAGNREPSQPEMQQKFPWIERFYR